MIRKLFQALTNYILSPDEWYDNYLEKEREPEDMSIIQKAKCVTCKNMTGELKSTMGTYTLYYCPLCKTTFSKKNENIIGGEMGKRKNKNKKNKKKNEKKTTFTNLTSKTKTTTIVSSTDDSWEVKIDCVKECSKVPDKVTIWIHPLAKRKIDAMMGEYKSIEWLAYLVGKKEEREVFDIFVPEQDISAASVDNIICAEYNDIIPIGVIHSHHGMGHSFSGTDNEWINQNHDISLVISNTGIAGQCRLKTDCGAYKIVDVDVKLKVSIDFDDKKFLESIKDKLAKKTWTYTSGYENYDGYGYGYQAGNWNRQYNPGATQNTAGKDVAVKVEDEASTFLTQDEVDEIEKEIEELDFTKELSLSEELTLLEETETPDDIESN